MRKLEHLPEYEVFNIITGISRLEIRDGKDILNKLEPQIFELLKTLASHKINHTLIGCINYGAGTPVFLDKLKLYLEYDNLFPSKLVDLAEAYSKEGFIHSGIINTLKETSRLLPKIFDKLNKLYPIRENSLLKSLVSQQIGKQVYYQTLSEGIYNNFEKNSLKEKTELAWSLSKPCLYSEKATEVL